MDFRLSHLIPLSLFTAGEEELYRIKQLLPWRLIWLDGIRILFCLMRKKSIYPEFKIIYYIRSLILSTI